MFYFRRRMTATCVKSPNACAFTLIELLVVVTIIVVLLALLVPAMDKAIYQAELTHCGARQKGMVSALLIYAGANGRHYPLNAIPRYAGTFAPNTLGRIASNVDIRPLLAEYVTYEHYLDPLLNTIDVSPAANSDETSVLCEQDVWAGFGYGGDHQKMRRMGDRASWTDADGLTVYFSLLFGDLNLYNGPLGSYTSHLDDQQSMSVYRLQDDTDRSNTTPTTISLWLLLNVRRGLIDVNYGYQDGSVQRFDKVDRIDEDRFTAVPWNASGRIDLGRFVPTGN